MLILPPSVEAQHGSPCDDEEAAAKGDEEDPSYRKYTPTDTSN